MPGSVIISGTFRASMQFGVLDIAPRTHCRSTGIPLVLGVVREETSTSYDHELFDLCSRNAVVIWCGKCAWSPLSKSNGGSAWSELPARYYQNRSKGSQRSWAQTLHWCLTLYPSKALEAYRRAHVKCRYEYQGWIYPPVHQYTISSDLCPESLDDLPQLIPSRVKLFVQQAKSNQSRSSGSVPLHRLHGGCFQLLKVMIAQLYCSSILPTKTLLCSCLQYVTCPSRSLCPKLILEIHYS